MTSCSHQATCKPLLSQTLSQIPALTSFFQRPYANLSPLRRVRITASQHPESSSQTSSVIGSAAKLLLRSVSGCHRVGLSAWSRRSGASHQSPSQKTCTSSSSQPLLSYWRHRCPSRNSTYPSESQNRSAVGPSVEKQIVAQNCHSVREVVAKFRFAAHSQRLVKRYLLVKARPLFSTYF